MTNAEKKKEFFISDDKKKIDAEYVHSFLFRSYWSEGIPLETVKKAIANSLCFGVYHKNKQALPTGRQVGFARMVTDKASFAYLADVFIDEQYRDKGLSKLLMQTIMSHPDLQGLRRIMLATKDAHGLYKKFGFTPLTNAGRWMQIHNRDVYKSK